MKLLHDAGYLIAFAILLAAAVFALAGPPPVPTATRPPAVPRKVETPPQAPPVAAVGHGSPVSAAPPAAPGRYTWTSNDAVPGQINLRRGGVNGVQIGAYRLADGVYLAFDGRRWATEASPPPVRLPSEQKIKAAVEVPAKSPFAERPAVTSPGTIVQSADGGMSAITRRTIASPAPILIRAPRVVFGGGTTIQCQT